MLLLTFGDLHWRANRSDDALGCYERCLAAHPHHAVALGRIGNALLARERYADAQGLLRRALQADGQPGEKAPSPAAHAARPAPPADPNQHDGG